MFDYLCRRASLTVLIALAGCAGMVASVEPGRSAAAPTYHVGDRWVYQAQDGFRSKSRWTESYEITAVGPAEIAVRVTQRGDGIDSVRMERWTAPGQVSVGAVYDSETRRFAMPLQRYNFPLRRGQVWNQWVDNVNDNAKTEGAINRYVVVGDWQKVTTPAGTFDAIQLRVLMRLDDDTFWRWPTTCSYLVWYAPDVRAVVREEREAGYVERGGPDVSTVWTQHGILELSAFTSGG